MTRILSNEEVLDVVERITDVMSGPGDVDVYPILDPLPLTSDNVIRILSALTVAAAAATLTAAGIDPAETTARVRANYAMPADDIPGFAKEAAQLVTMGCDFLLAHHDDLANDALIRAVTHVVTAHGPEFAFLAMGEVLACIRRLLHGDTRGVLVK